MVVAEVLPDGRVEILERLQRAVRLGQDTFRRGRLGALSMRAAIAVLRDYQKLLHLYHAEGVRAVATTAVREASNAEMFLDRVFLATGLQVDVIDTSEESRLTVSAVRRALGNVLGDEQAETLIVDVGGGSTLLTFLLGSEIVTSQSLRLGSVRLQELLSISEETPRRSAEMLRSHIGNVITSAHRSLPLDGIRSFVAVGGDARFAARQIGQPTEVSELTLVEAEQFDRLVHRCERLTAEEISKRHGLTFAEAETINPALLVYQALLRRCKADKMLVSNVSMRDGLLLELAQQVTGAEDEAMLAGIIHSAMTLAERYHADPEHGRNVAELAVRFFDFLQSDHGLRARHRLLLRVAALLHEIGGFVSNRSHHKHSEYLIANSEIFGLSRGEIAVVAQIARYHRRSPPRASHPAYVALPRESRVIVNKLAAVLRVADALARGRLRKMRELRIERAGDELLLTALGQTDLMLERHSLAAKGGLFEEVYGMKVRLEEG
jgi:exopolyphosphatase/guanosine-5'-triphosphate,3'-diphosphate pyrophosphatase